MAILNEVVKYSLAVRKWPSSENSPESSLPLPQGFDWDNDAAFAEIGKTVAEDFGSDVICDVRIAALLLRNGHEDLDRGLLLSPGDKLGFKHVSLFLNMFQMGRRLNISVYTLFSPIREVTIATHIPLIITGNNQKGQTRSIRKIQESLIRMLKGIQQQKQLLAMETLKSQKSQAIALKENQQQKVSVFENTLRASVLRGIALYKEKLGSGGEVTY
jgi:hypothetical protein